MSAAWRQLHIAMYALASEGTQCERLIRVYDHNLSRLIDKDLPKEVRSEFMGLLDEMQRLKLRVEQRGEEVSEREVAVLVRTVLGLYDIVARYQPIERSGRNN